jgi:hypothetical protein
MTATDTTKRKNTFTSTSNTMFFSSPSFSILLPLLKGFLPLQSQAFSVPFWHLFVYLPSTGGRVFLLLSQTQRAQRGVARHGMAFLTFFTPSACSGCNFMKFNMGGVRGGRLHGLTP